MFTTTKSSLSRPRRNIPNLTPYLLAELEEDDDEEEFTRKKSPAKKCKRTEKKATSSPISGPPRKLSLPKKTTYINELYPNLSDIDLLEMADMEHQKRKLNEAIDEIFNAGYTRPNDAYEIDWAEIKREAKLKADKRTPRLLLQIAKQDLGIEASANLPPLGEHQFPLIRYINETPHFEVHTFLPEDLQGNQSPAMLLGHADECTLSNSRIIYEAIANRQA